MTTRTAQLLGGVGRTLITLGALVVLFAVYQLWGTSLTEQQAQDSLEDSFEERREALQSSDGTQAAAAPATTPPSTAAPTTVPGDATTSDDGGATSTSAAPTPQPVVAPELAEELVPELGETVGRIEIPAIGVDKYVVEGVRRSDLRQGPGHYPETPLPGQAGNAAIAGHRTTYGAPFGDLDRLVPGDEIIVETLQGRFHYEVMGHPGPDGTTVGHHIVDPYEGVVVLEDHDDNRLTLTACHPRYSARQRIVVTAELVTPPAPVVVPAAPVAASPADPAADEADVAGGAAGDITAPPDDGADPAGGDVEPEAGSGGAGVESDAGTGEAGVESDDRSGGAGVESGGEGDDVALDASLGWNTDELPRAVAWGALTAGLAVAVVALGRMWRRWPAWLLGSPFVVVALFVTFGYLDRMMPAL